MSPYRAARTALGRPAHAVVTLAGIPITGYVWARDVAASAGDLLQRGHDLIRRANALLDLLEDVVGQVSLSNARAGAGVSRTELLALDSDHVIAEYGDVLTRTGLLLRRHEPATRSASPAADRSATVVGPGHADGLVSLLELVPEVLDLVESTFRGLGDLSPALGQLVARFEAIGQIVETAPGAAILRRRGSDAVR